MLIYSYPKAEVGSSPFPFKFAKFPSQIITYRLQNNLLPSNQVRTLRNIGMYVT